MSRAGDEHMNGDCWPSQCPACAYEDSVGWRCEAHNLTVIGDCPECDVELIALADELPTSPGGTR